MRLTQLVVRKCPYCGHDSHRASAVCDTVWVGPWTHRSWRCQCRAGR